MPDRAEMRLARQASVYLAQDSAEARARSLSVLYSPFQPNFLSVSRYMIAHLLREPLGLTRCPP